MRNLFLYYVMILEEKLRFKNIVRFMGCNFVIK